MISDLDKKASPSPYKKKTGKAYWELNEVSGGGSGGEKRGFQGSGN